MFDIFETLIKEVMNRELEKTDYGLLIKYFYAFYGVSWASKLQQVIS